MKGHLMGPKMDLWTAMRMVGKRGLVMVEKKELKTDL